MGQTTIGWTGTLVNEIWHAGYSFNPWFGCFKISPGCTHCYAEEMTKHFSPGVRIWGPASTTSRRLFGESHWKEPLAWNRKAEKLGTRLKVFCASMADVFEDHPQVEPEREKLWPLIEQTRWLNWLLLTKRPENIEGMVPSSWYHQFPDNVWMGTSVENQQYAEERIPHLLYIPAVVHFLSCEPLLEQIDLTSYLPSLDWVITGGESGAKHRPMHPSWAGVVRDQCNAYGTPFFHKQNGGLTHNSGGRLLDGRTWDEMPQGIVLERSMTS